MGTQDLEGSDMRVADRQLIATIARYGDGTARRQSVEHVAELARRHHAADRSSGAGDQGPRTLREVQLHAHVDVPQ